MMTRQFVHILRIPEIKTISKWACNNNNGWDESAKIITMNI